MQVCTALPMATITSEIHVLLMCTVRHSSLKMTCTLAQLGEYIEKMSSNPHIFTAGHSVDYEVPDQITKGFTLLGEDTGTWQ